MKFDPTLKVAWWSPHTSIIKRNCTELNYYEDKYIKYFSPKTSQHPLASLRMCLRVLGLRKALTEFVNLFPNKKVQFVNLGAGLDTLSLWLLKNFENVVCYDSDLEYQVKLKVNVILRTKELLDLFPNYKSTESTFSSERYNLFPFDLCNYQELNKLKDFGFSEQLPTLYLSESAINALHQDESNKLIKYLYEFSKGPTAYVFLEYVNANTKFMRFGETICKNHNITHHSLHAYPTKKSQLERYKSLGWDNVFVHDLTFVYNNLLDKNERSRLRKIENFNDLKNLSLYCSHYLFGFTFNNYKEFENFKLFLNKSNTKVLVDNDDELLPQYTVEELDKDFDYEYFENFYKSLFEVTYSTESEESKTFYQKFT